MTALLDRTVKETGIQIKVRPKLFHLLSFGLRMQRDCCSRGTSMAAAAQVCLESVTGVQP